MTRITACYHDPKTPARTYGPGEWVVCIMAGSLLERRRFDSEAEARQFVDANGGISR